MTCDLCGYVPTDLRGLRSHCARKHGGAGWTRPQCDVEGCSLDVTALGYCNRHYIRLRKYGNPVGTPAPHTKRPVVGKPPDEGPTQGPKPLRSTPPGHRAYLAWKVTT